MKKILLLSMLLMALQTTAQKNFGYLAWDINKPLSNTSWLGATSSKGGKFGYRGVLNSNDRISIGGEFSWATFSEYKPEETIYSDSGALTTDFFSYVYQYA